MEPPKPPSSITRPAPVLPDEALYAEMERIEEPAILYLRGGRIAAMNGAMSRLTAYRAVGQSMLYLVNRSRSRRADGSPLLPNDLPYARALRGEVVDQGERIDIVLPEGSVYAALVTSTPIIRDGTVVAALSIWNNFSAYVQDLAERPPIEK